MLENNPSLLGVDPNIDYFYTSMQGTDFDIMDGINDNIALLGDSIIASDSILSDSLRTLISQQQLLVVSANVLISSERNINRIYIHWMELGLDSIPAADSLFVDSMARKCPTIYGPTVYKARMLHNLWNPTVNWNDVQLCPLAGSASKGAVPANGSDDYLFSLGTDGYGEEENIILPAGKIIIFPNPSDGYFTIQHSYDVLEDIVDIQITDALGRVVFAEAQKFDTKKYKLDLRSLNSGVYTLKVNSLNIKTYVSKITIIH